MPAKAKRLLTTGERRKPEGILGKIVYVTCLGLTIFEIWLSAFGTIPPYAFAVVFLLTVMAINFIITSPCAGVHKIGWVDISLAILTFAIEIYLIINNRNYYVFWFIRKNMLKRNWISDRIFKVIFIKYHIE